MSEVARTADSPDERRVRYVSPEARREQENEIERLLVAGVSQHRIEGAMLDRHQMTRTSTRAVMARVRRRWAEEERGNRPHYKATAMRRLLGHIAEARVAKNFASVAQLERLLAEMQGTREPVEVNLNVETTVTEAALHVIGKLTPEKFRALVEEQKRLRALAATPKVLDVQGVEVKDPPP